MLDGKKTLIANFLMIVIAILESTGWTNLFPDMSPETIALVITVINIILRFLTTGPVKLKKG